MEKKKTRSLLNGCMMTSPGDETVRSPRLVEVANYDELVRRAYVNHVQLHIEPVQ